MTDDNPLFIDTNILIYANVATAPLHEQALKAIKDAHQTGRDSCGSAARCCVSSSLPVPGHRDLCPTLLIPEVIIERVRYLEDRFQVADDTTAVTRQLVKLMSDFRIGGKQVHDANIVATMLAYDIPCLLTHNVKDFRRFGEVVRIEGIDA
jgi:predicted nucleic acid-binding protein